MQYKCFKTCKIGNKIISEIGDYLSIDSDKVYNLTSGAAYTNFDNMEKLKSCLESVEDFNKSCSEESKHPFTEITDKMFKTYLKKNKDYGNSFDQSLDKWGLSVAAIRLGDKLNRFESYVKNGSFSVKDEGVRDTLMDLATYSIMTIMYLDGNV